MIKVKKMCQRSKVKKFTLNLRSAVSLDGVLLSVSVDFCLNN